MADRNEKAPPILGVTKEGRTFHPPVEATCWKVFNHDRLVGRPSLMWGNKGPLLIDLYADMDEFRRAVKNKPGTYRLYPVDEHGNEYEPVAVVEVVPDESDESSALVAPGGRAPYASDPFMTSETPGRFFDLYERMLTSRDAHDEMMTRIVTTLVTTTAGIQQSTAGLLESASTTIRVANGVHAMDRVEPPQLDIEGLSDKLAVVGQLKQTISALGDDERKPGTPWMVQLLNGPVGMTLMSMAGNFAKTVAATAAQQQAAQQAQARPAQPSQPAPQPSTPPQPDAGNGAEDHDEDSED